MEMLFLLTLLSSTLVYCFFPDAEAVTILRWFNVFAVSMFIGQQVFKLLLVPDRGEYFRERRFEFHLSAIFVTLVLLLLLFIQFEESDGLGLMTFTTFFAMFSGRLGVKERVAMNLESNVLDSVQLTEERNICPVEAPIE